MKIFLIFFHSFLLVSSVDVENLMSVCFLIPCYPFLFIASRIYFIFMVTWDKYAPPLPARLAGLSPCSAGLMHALHVCGIFLFCLLGNFCLCPNSSCLGFEIRCLWIQWLLTIPPEFSGSCDTPGPSFLFKAFCWLYFLFLLCFLPRLLW